MHEIITVEKLVRKILPKFRLQNECFLKFDDCAVRVVSNSSALIALLKNYYQEFLSKPQNPLMTITACEGRPMKFGVKLNIKQPDPGKNKIKEEFIDLSDGRLVVKRMTGMEFVFNKDFSVALGACVKNSNQIVNFINNRYIQWRLNSGCCLLHAAAVEHHGHGAGLCGFSGMGKSTLSLHLMSRGTDFVSNDRLMIQKFGRGLKMFGVAKLPRINPGTVLNNPDLLPVIPAAQRKRFAQLPTDELWKLEHKYDVDVHHIFGRDRFRLSAGMKALFILNWKRNGKPLSVKKVDLKFRKDLWPAFIKDPGLFYQPDHPHYFSEYATPQAYMDHLKRVSVYELSGGVDFDAAAEKILKIIK